MDQGSPPTKRKILAIDDEPGVISFLEDGLKGAGYLVETAGDGATGLTKAKEMVPDLILLDVAMEGMDGFQVLEQLKKDKKLMKIPVIMLTGREEPQDIEEGISHYADKYITKPFEFKYLLEEIEKTLAIL